MKDLLKIINLNKNNFLKLLSLSFKFKNNPYCNSELLKNKTIALYFTKPSTRTRISFETAIVQFGGTPLVLNYNDLQLGRGESIEDTARIFSLFCSGLVIRTFKDEELELFAKFSTIPVINALTNLHHPCQSIADIMTISEHYPDISKIKITYIGDGNNVAHSLIESSAILGLNLVISCPPGYEPNPNILKGALIIAEKTGSNIIINHDFMESAKNADVIYTDTWLSMGQEESEKNIRFEAFKKYQVNKKLMKLAKETAIFMHCLPAHRDYEVTSDIIDGKQSVVFQQSENRLYTAMGVLFALLKTELE